MLPLRLVFDITRAGKTLSVLDHYRFLSGLNHGLMAVVDNFMEYVVEGTRRDIFAPELKVLISLPVKTEFLHGIAHDYMEHIRKHKPDEFDSRIEYKFGKQCADILKQDPSATIQFASHARHELWYYDFLRDLPGWKILDGLLSPTDIMSEVFLSGPSKDDKYFTLASCCTRRNSLSLMPHGSRSAKSRRNAKPEQTAAFPMHLRISRVNCREIQEPLS